jgi:hypothetical protein
MKNPKPWLLTALLLVPASFVFAQTFTKITAGAIVDDRGSSYAASWGDYDNDGDLDLFVANDGNNFLYRNNGDGSFARITAGAIVNDGGRSYGCAWGDYDKDGDLDLFVANAGANNFLYRNDGPAGFAKITAGAIVNDGGNSTGCAWADYDNDGDLDLFVANEGPNSLYRNDDPQRAIFTKITTGEIVTDTGLSRGAVWGDYNNDGALDLFVANSGINNLLYRNNGNSNNWINISLIGTFSNASAIGARVSVKSTINSVPVWQIREISAQTGAFSQNSLNAEFGLGDAGIIDSIKVAWPGGIVQTLTNVAPKQFLTITEPQFTRVTGSVVTTDRGNSYGGSWADYDNDGDLDLFVTNSGGENNFLYRNNGPAGFAKITEGAIPLVRDGGNSFGSSWGDYDNDGDLDLFVANGSNQNNFLYRNDGPAGFAKIDTGAIVTDGGSSFGCAWGDYDNDGHLDLFVANIGNNFLYRNNGNGSFTKITAGRIVTDGGNSQGCNWGDYDNDGDLDLFVANAGGENNFLYRNNGDRTFERILSGQIVNNGGNSFSASWGDYDNDGDLDLFVSNDGGNNFLYENNGTGNFTRINTGAIVEDGGRSFGSSWGDFDNDGDLDLFVAKLGDDALYRNNGGDSFTKVTAGDIVQAG